MTRTGIDDPWRPEDEPEPLGDWVEAGIPREEAEIWRNWRFHIPEATAWRDAGIFSGLEAARWSAVRVTPVTVQQWEAAGINATEAAEWHEFGFDFATVKQHRARGLTPAQAFDQQHGLGLVPLRRVASLRQRSMRGLDVGKFVGAGISHELIRGYADRSWTDDEALSWAKEGVDVVDAQLWKELGLKPVEAGRLARRGVTALQTVTDWWRAGIPIDEVADWIGAGLKPGEAADQRARGITAEQAAALRALRDDPDDD